jgi:hypothetical protein
MSKPGREKLIARPALLLDWLKATAETRKMAGEMPPKAGN